MSYIDVRMPLMFRRWLYFLLALSWLSGIGFFILNRFVMIEGDFGPQRHPLQFPVLMVHGASAFLVMISYGSVLINHVGATWRLKRLRGFGIALVSVLVFQFISAYLLYYLSSDDVRGVVANMHALVGLTFPVVLTTHIVTGLRERRQMQARLAERKKARVESRAAA